MKIIGNILWLLLGGIVSGMLWLGAGVLWCLTVVGIPIGMQCFKFSVLSFCPFGKKVEYGGGVFSMLGNILWLVFSGIPLAIVNITFGILLCITIIGIPFGKQYFKIAKLALMPFGATVYRD